jgi:hypothetical protein
MWQSSNEPGGDAGAGCWGAGRGCKHLDEVAFSTGIASERGGCEGYPRRVPASVSLARHHRPNAANPRPSVVPGYAICVFRGPRP